MMFSLIVPVYNVQEYVKDCVLSILNQTYKDIEIILVDDGSNDASGILCDDFLKVDSRVNVFHKENGGLSDARNFGIDKATGTYLIFVDADDVLIPNAVENMYLRLSKFHVDVLITEMYNTDDIFSIYPEKMFENDGICQKEEAIQFVFKQKMHTWPAPQYIVRNEFVKKNNLRFDVGFYHEDVSWTSRLFAVADTFAYMNNTCYLRRVSRENSITNVVSAKRTKDALTLINRELQSNLYYDITSAQREYIFSRLVTSVFTTLTYSAHFNSYERQEISDILDQGMSLYLRYATKLKHKSFLLLSCVFGVRRIIDVVAMLYRWR